MTPSAAARRAADALPVLHDARRREIRYLRISLTDRCNYACTYCVPPGGWRASASEDLLDLDTVARYVRLMVQRGVRRVRLTGGEPLIRRGVVEFVAALGAMPGLDEVAMTTNGHVLDRFAEPLHRAGLGQLNISLDTLDPERFAEITGGGDLERVLAGIDAAEAAGFGGIKINTVALEANDGERAAIAEHCWSHGRLPRFIEKMPLGGLDAGRVTAPELLAELSAVWPLAPLERSDAPRGPARYHSVTAGRWAGARVGLIAPMSDPDFCATCNRARLTARGDLRACLADDRQVSLSDALRRGEADERLIALTMDALDGKRPAHRMNETGGEPMAAMTGIGG